MKSLNNIISVKNKKLKYKKILKLQNKENFPIINKETLSKLNNLKKNFLLKKKSYNLKRKQSYKSALYSLNYLIPIASLFFSSTAYIQSINAIKKKYLIRPLHFNLKKNLVLLIAMRKKIKLLRNIKISNLNFDKLILKISSKCNAIELKILQMLNVFKNIFFLFLKEIQLIHLKNAFKIKSPDNVSILKKAKTARWLKRSRFKKTKRLYFNNLYSQRLVKSICLKIFWNFNKILKVTKKSPYLKNKMSSFLKFNSDLYIKQKSKKKKTNRKIF